MEGKGTKFSDTNKCIKIKLESLLKRGVNWGEMVRKGRKLTYTSFVINSSKFCDYKIQKRTIKYSNSFAVHLQIGNKTAL